MKMGNVLSLGVFLCAGALTVPALSQAPAGFGAVGGVIRDLGGSGIPGTTRAAEAYGTERTLASGTTDAMRRLQATNGIPTDNRKQQYVRKTRVNANGGGASGPEPEREWP